MYVKLLNEAVSLMKRRNTRPSGGPGTAWWICRCRHTSPKAYIDSLSLRLDVYRRIAEVETQEDSMDVLDELIDRFGEPPASVKGLLDGGTAAQHRRPAGRHRGEAARDSLLIYKEKFDMDQVAPLIKALGGGCF